MAQDPDLKEYDKIITQLNTLLESCQDYCKTKYTRLKDFDFFHPTNKEGIPSTYYDYVLGAILHFEMDNLEQSVQNKPDTKMAQAVINFKNKHNDYNISTIPAQILDFNDTNSLLQIFLDNQVQLVPTNIIPGVSDARLALSGVVEHSNFHLFLIGIDFIIKTKTTDKDGIKNNRIVTIKMSHLDPIFFKAKRDPILLYLHGATQDEIKQLADLITFSNRRLITVLNENLTDEEALALYKREVAARTNPPFFMKEMGPGIYYSEGASNLASNKGKIMAAIREASRTVFNLKETGNKEKFAKYFNEYLITNYDTTAINGYLQTRTRVALKPHKKKKILSN